MFPFLRTGLRSMLKRNHLVQGEATMESLQRFVWVSLVMVPMHFALSWWFGRQKAMLPQGETMAWASSVGFLHACAGALVLVLALVVQRELRRSARASIGAIFLHVLLCAMYLLIGMTLSSVGIASGTGSASSFILACVLVGVLSLMRPAISVPLFATTLLVFLQVVQVMHRNETQLTSLRVNVFAVCVLSALVSIVIWQHYASMVILRRELDRKNAALEAKQIELVQLAERDALTGLYNRREFMRRANDALTTALRSGLDVHVVMIDIDFFKKVNDSHGHTAGDEVLRQTASLLAANVRATDTVARLGGEEFVLLLPDTTLAGALALAEKIRVALAKKPLEADGQAIAVSASFGVSGLPAGSQASMEQLLTSADHALYDAKHKGRNRVEAATCEVARGPDGPARRQSREDNLTSVAPLADKWLPPH